MAISKKMRLSQITQTAVRSQAIFIEDVKPEEGKPQKVNKMFSLVTDDAKDLQGLSINKVYTITIS